MIKKKMEEEKGEEHDPQPETEENEEVNQEQVSFPDNLWGSLESIRENAKKGTNILEGVIAFAKNFHRSYESYAANISKGLEGFEREMLKYNTLDTTTICMSSFCSEMKNMLDTMKTKAAEFDELIYNPSILFTKHYVEQNRKYLDDAKKYLAEIEAARKQVEKSKLKYEKRSDLKEGSEQEIEQKLREHEEGVITFEQMQETANKAVNIKYKAEVALQDYKQDVEYLNNLIADSDKRYRPCLASLQQHEERRINFVKYTMEKFLTYYNDCNTVLLEKEDKFSDSVKMINHHTDLQIFVDENRSRIDKDSFFHKAKVQLYDPKKRNESRQKLGDVDRQNSTDASSVDNEEYKDLNLPSREELETSVKTVKSKIREMIRTPKQLTMEEKADLLNMLHHKEVNHRVTEELKTITDVKEYHVLKDLSELVNYMITESINDKHNDFKIINNILCSASLIYCRQAPDGTPQIRKTYLTDLIKNHALWTETNRWKTWIY